MPVAINTHLPLEALLAKHAKSRRSKFPNRSADYFARYIAIKQHLADNYYRVAGAGLSAPAGDRFTLHDIYHVDDVINVAGRLLGLESGANTPAINDLEPYEVYALLVATLLHDAGNAVAREGHEKMPATILDEISSVADFDAFERRVIAQIAQAHGGRAEDGDKDTIGKIVNPEFADIGAVAKVKGRRLAAILRFADELSENSRRADSLALQRPYKKAVSVLPNLFCKCINVSVDYEGRSIAIAFIIDRAVLDEKFKVQVGKRTRDEYFIDYVVGRLEKCELERRYCNRFLANWVTYERLRVSLQVVGGGRSRDPIAFELADRGYPTDKGIVRGAAPEFTGTLIQARYAAEEKV